MTEKKLLLVDDTPEVLNSLEKVLSKYYSVCTARNADEALEALEVLDEEAPFDAALVDYAMPGQNGIELIQEIKRQYPSTQSILLTSHSDPETVMTAVSDSSINKYLMKPVAIQKLLDVIEEMLK
jgi:response regulator RpfG family c-di-GMP phosphodiesterase